MTKLDHDRIEIELLDSLNEENYQTISSLNSNPSLWHVKHSKVVKAIIKLIKKGYIKKQTSSERYYLTPKFHIWNNSTENETKPKPTLEITPSPETPKSVPMTGIQLKLQPLDDGNYQLIDFKMLSCTQLPVQYTSHGSYVYSAHCGNNFYIRSPNLFSWFKKNDTLTPTVVAQLKRNLKICGERLTSINEEIKKEKRKKAKPAQPKLIIVRI